MKLPNDTCPECGKTESLPIFWGCQPPAETAELIERGEVIHGGCDFYAAVECGRIMNRECQACGHQWYVREA